MDSYVKTITLDVNADQNYTIVKAKQGDKINRKIAITLKKDGANFTPTGVSEIWFRVEKPDKNIAIVKSTDSGSPISVSGNVYTVSLSEQCLTASGKAWCDLAFLDSSGNTLSSCAFIMNIIPMPNGNTAESISEWTDLQKAIDDAERFANIIAFRTSENYIQYTVDGESWANLMPVSSVSNVFDAGTVTHDDCNNFIEGLVKYTPSTLNIPEPSYGIVCGYVAQNKNWKWQVAKTTQTPSKIYKRSNINNGGWSDWKKIADEDDISALSEQIIDLNDITGDGVLSGFSATNLTEAANELKDSLNTVCLRAEVKTISGNGTSSNTLAGLTANHIIGNWGMFSDAACTTPIPENSPTCDITITTAANSWSVTIENFSSTFYLRPTFILKQN